MQYLKNISEVVLYLKTLNNPDCGIRSITRNVDIKLYLEVNGIAGSGLNEYIDIILKYDLSHFEVRYYSFSFSYMFQEFSYEQRLVKTNNPDFDPHFEENRNLGFIIIGVFEQDDILLNINTGEVYLYFHSSNQRHLLANSMSDLLLILGNAVKIRKEFKDKAEGVMTVYLNTIGLSTNELPWSEIIFLTV